MQDTIPTLTKHENKVSDEVQSFRRMRRVIGLLGGCLPAILVLLSLIPLFDTDIQPSISHYYYTNLREIFTGLLCSVGLFFLLYKGYKEKNLLKSDNFLTNMAGIFAFGIAFFPTNPECCYEKTDTLISSCANWLGNLHYAFAGLFFLTLAYMSIFVFTLGNKAYGKSPKHPFLPEHFNYRLCGVIMILACAGVAFIQGEYHTLIFEAVALGAFSLSWLIKGRFLGSSGVIGRNLYGKNT